MKKLNAASKKAQGIINAYFSKLSYYGRRELSDCYNSPSEAKKLAYEHCLQLNEQLNGFNDTILSFNCQMFSYAFRYRCNKKLCLAYITRYDEYYIELGDEEVNI